MNAERQLTLRLGTMKKKHKEQRHIREEEYVGGSDKNKTLVRRTIHRDQQDTAYDA